MRRLLPLLLVPLTACTLSSDPAADSVGKAEKASRSAAAGEGRELLPRDPEAPTLTFDAPAIEVVFTPDKATARAGVVNIRFTTDGAHNWTLGGPEDLVWGDPAGRPVDVTHAVELAAGSYGFFCSVPGHKAAGMTGTLTIT